MARAIVAERLEDGRVYPQPTALGAFAHADGAELHALHRLAAPSG
jgi:hypothetical protein